MMKSSEQLLILANELENPDNEILIETDDDQVEKVAEALVRAAEILREAAEELDPVEVNKKSLLTPEALDELSILATSFDESNDELLMKQAALIDELLLTIAADKSLIRKAKDDEDNRIEDLKKVYQKTKEDQDKLNGVKEAVETIEKSDSYKEYRPLMQSLSTRHCPDHPGVSTHRVSEHTIQCPTDNKIYNFDEGYTTLQGNKVPGGEVSLQTKMDNASFSTFNNEESDTRAGRNGQT